MFRIRLILTDSFNNTFAQPVDKIQVKSTRTNLTQVENIRFEDPTIQRAQQNYENELVKHTEAAKTLQKVRSDLNDLKVQMVELKRGIELPRTNLTQSEESWLNSQARYEHEPTAVREGKEKSAEYNDRLHELTALREGKGKPAEQK
ncbi:MAG: hypothetical protein Q9210_005085 [Variospora velana]